MELETIIHSLENSQIRRKPESDRTARENTSQTDINDNNLSNTKQLDPVPQSKEKLCHVCGSEKHETKDWEPKKNIYVTDQNNIQQIIINTGSKQITLTIIQKRKIKDTRNM